jgi:HD-like signal output (HDOD) protein
VPRFWGTLALRRKDVQENNGSSAPAPYQSIPASDTARQARNQLFQKISEENDLPALGGSVSRVVQLASSNDEAIRKLAYLVLSDVGLTQKILRISNSVVYRTRSGSPITTISKAIFLLGFDTIKTSALAMMLVDGISGKRGLAVRQELSQALAASIFARELARRSHFKDAEEAAIAALFGNIGRIFVASHDHVLYKQITDKIREGASSSQASLNVLGCTFEMLTESVLQEWQMPETIVQALAPLHGSQLKAPKNRQEWMQQVTAFSSAAGRLLALPEGAARAEATKNLVARYGAALNLDDEKMGQLFASVAEESRVLTANVNLPPVEPVRAADDAAATKTDVQSAGETRETDETGEYDLPSDLLMLSTESGVLNIDQRHPSGKPVNARDLLLAGVQDVTEMMASGKCAMNDLVLLVLETLYRSLGFRFATVCLKDVKTHQYRARITLGEKNAERQSGFVFSAAHVRDLFHLAMENDADLLISDATDPKIRDLIPEWHRALLPDARSFIVLPLVVHKKPLGLFYADRAQAATEGMPADETALIRTLKRQVLTVLHSR